MQVGTTVPQGAATLSTAGWSAGGRNAAEGLAKQYPGSRLVDAGKTVVGQVTWTRVAIVTGVVVTAVILIDPSTGQKMAEAGANAGMAIMTPFIPSIIFSCILLCLLLSLGFGGYMVMQQMR